MKNTQKSICTLINKNTILETNRKYIRYTHFLLFKFNHKTGYKKFSQKRLVCKLLLETKSITLLKHGFIPHQINTLPAFQNAHYLNI